MPIENSIFTKCSSIFETEFSAEMFMRKIFHSYNCGLPLVLNIKYLFYKCHLRKSCDLPCVTIYKCDTACLGSVWFLKQTFPLTPYWIEKTSSFFKICMLNLFKFNSVTFTSIYNLPCKKFTLQLFIVFFSHYRTIRKLESNF